LKPLRTTDMCVTVIIQKDGAVRSEANAEFVDVSRGDKDNVNLNWYVRVQ